MSKFEPTIAEAKVFIESYPIVDMYIDTFYQSHLGGHNVFIDNSMELYEYWEMMKRISEQKQESANE